ncbi:MAG: Lrp/AsnC family transcriptional regulator [Fidelibacterota bacterium]
MLSDTEINLIRVIQGDIPLVSRPFFQIAERMGIPEDEVIRLIRKFIRKGVVRRFGALLNHTEVGLAENAMVVWKVPLDRVEEVGRIMASYSEVSHCYLRKTLPSWDYNMYTMIHAGRGKSCHDIVRSISLRTGIKDFLILKSLKQFKKSSMKFFDEG